MWKSPVKFCKEEYIRFPLSSSVCIFSHKVYFPLVSMFFFLLLTKPLLYLRFDLTTTTKLKTCMKTWRRNNNIAEIQQHQQLESTLSASSLRGCFCLFCTDFGSFSFALLIYFVRTRWTFQPGKRKGEIFSSLSNLFVVLVNTNVEEHFGNVTFLFFLIPFGWRFSFDSVVFWWLFHRLFVFRLRTML